MKQIHYFDIDNDRLYMSSEPAYLDEAETRRQGKEVYFCPYNATLIKPPVVQENESARFNGESWEVVTNYRGKYQVNENMEVSIVTELGELEEGYILITEEQAQQIENDRDYYIIQNGELVINPNWEEIQRQKERQELDGLTLTPADVERALYKAKGMDFEDLKALIAQRIPSIDIKGLAIEFRAKDFYRGAEAGGMRLFDVVGALLGYSPEQMDYLFIHKELPEEGEN